jgi:Fe-Mn family superoxide dismutase
MRHELPQLLYEYDALEPYIDARTMEIHHGKHHLAYVTKLNEIVAGTPTLHGKPIEEILSALQRVPEGAQPGIRNFGGGHFNHSFFWKVMAPASPTIMEKRGGGEAHGKLAEALTMQFGSFLAFKEQFTKTANSVFGSGWTWLVAGSGGKLSIISTPNQDCPLSVGLTPITVLDEWEHAYYLSYQNRRPEYVEAFWNVANWYQAEENYCNAMGL